MCISLDWHGILAVLSPLGSYHRLDFRVLCSLYIFCVGHLSAVFTTSHHLCSTEVSSASFLSSARSVTTSTNIERHSHCPQRQGYQISIIGYEMERCELIFQVMTTCRLRALLCIYIYTLTRGAFCSRQLLLEVCTESTRLLLGSDRSPGVTATHSVRYCSVISIRLA